jgi:hypothetical protein
MCLLKQLRDALIMKWNLNWRNTFFFRFKVLINLYFNCHYLLLKKKHNKNIMLLFLKRLWLFYNDIINCFMNNFALALYVFFFYNNLLINIEWEWIFLLVIVLYNIFYIYFSYFFSCRCEEMIGLYLFYFFN